jgi:hydroxymethylglutaryl-CoA reductase
MIGQIQIVGVKDPYGARLRVLEHKQELLEKANEQDSLLVSLGGGAKDVDGRVIHTSRGDMLIVELHVDCRDAMGANAVNTMSESISSEIAKITGGRVYMRILTNWLLNVW